VRAHIRNALDSVLTKPPLMSKQIFNTFIEDIEQIRKLSLRKDDMGKYLETKYFKYFSDATFEGIARSLWRVVFKSSDSRASLNREINLEALVILFSKSKANLLSSIKSDRDWFSEVSTSDDHINSMISFFQKHPEIFPYLTDALKIPMRTFAESNLDNLSMCWFISENHEAHVNLVLSRVEEGGSISTDTFKQFHTSLLNPDTALGISNIGIRLYCKSPNWGAANFRFREMILPLLDHYQKENYIELMKGCETCTDEQATTRNNAAKDHKQVRDKFISAFPRESTAPYKSFNDSIDS
jgi:hypothetical protein